MVNQVAGFIAIRTTLLSSSCHACKSLVREHFNKGKSDKKVVCQYEDGNKAKCGAELGANLKYMAYHLTRVHHVEQGHGPVSCALFGLGKKV